MFVKIFIKFIFNFSIGLLLSLSGFSIEEELIETEKKLKSISINLSKSEHFIRNRNTKHIDKALVYDCCLTKQRKNSSEKTYSFYKYKYSIEFIYKNLNSISNQIPLNPSHLKLLRISQMRC